MTIDIETMLERGDFSLPVFAEFILDKYQDIQHIHPDSAKKIEERVFTPGFLKTILSGGSVSLKARAFGRVPAACFSGLGAEIEACLSDPEAPGGIPGAAGVLKTVGPDHYRRAVTGMLDRAMAVRPVSGESFNWLKFFHDLPQDLQKDFLGRSMALLLENQDDLSLDSNLEWVLTQTLEAALCLGDPGAAGLAVLVTGMLVDDFDPQESDVYGFCFDFFRYLTPVPDSDRIDFELDLFFHLDSGNMDRIPAVVDGLYSPGPQGQALSRAFADFQKKEDFDDLAPWLDGEVAGQESFLTGILSQILSDRSLMGKLREKKLTRNLAAACLCLVWQEKKVPDFTPEPMSDADLAAYLALDTMYLPFKDSVQSFISGMEEVRQAKVLVRAMTAGLERWTARGTGIYSLATILRLMGSTGNPDYLPLVLQGLRWRVEEGNDRFYEDIIDGVCRFGDRVFDQLDPIVHEIPDVRLLDILSVVRRLSSPRAEDFLLNHKDRFLGEFRADTLDAFQMLVSRRGLDLVAHKVGKAQPGVDELYAVVNIFEGNGGPEVQQALEGIISTEEVVREGVKAVEQGLPRDVMRLEMKCASCSDVSFYDCRNIMVSPQGGAYVAEERTCISCGRISEFELSSHGMFAVQAETMRVFMGREDDEEVFPGAVKIMNTAFFGRPMAIGEGISLYKEKIRRDPRNPDHRIGLGNAFRSVNQTALAREQYEKAIESGPFYVEAYLSLARLDARAGNHESALDWLEKGRPFLKRPLICRSMETPAGQILEGYRDLHFDLVKETGRPVTMIRDSECMTGGASLKKIGPNEKCPCGSGKKYKKCCKRKQ